MKKKLLSALFLLFLLPFTLSPDSASTYAFSEDHAVENSEKAPQSAQKEKFDYMSSILSRNTKPLGLKENISLRKFLNQPSIKWAMRSGSRHLLN
jgi:hypothetical protein